MTTTKIEKPLCFVDAAGGALASLGAAVARALGHADAVAATLGQTDALPADVAAVLEEVAFAVPSTDALTLDEQTASTHVLVWLGEGAPPKGMEGARSVACKLLAPEAGELERMATARIARDRIERFLETALG